MMSAVDAEDSRFDRQSRRTEAAAWSARSRGGIVACAHYLAADVGAEILGAGGNAADAAVATALALNVCEPAASGLGGMAVALVHEPGSPAPACYQGPCLAPAAATPELVENSHRYRGFRAVAVPGAPAMWSALLARHGRMPLRELAQPAIEIARKGYRITALQHRLATTYRDALLGGDSGERWLDAAGLPHPIGAVVRQDALADTIERLATAGLMDFYRGEVAREIDADMRAHDGFVAAGDLRSVTEPEASTALQASFLGGTLFTAGPPAGGLALAQLAAMTTALGRPLDLRRPRDLLLVVGMIRRVRQDRRRYRLRVGNRSLERAAELLTDEVAARAVREAAGAGDADGTGETSHLCVMDRAGMTVSMTVSIERSFGAACMSPRLGFLYNGYLRGFKVRNRRHPHFLQPGIPARSNAAPTIAVDADGSSTAIGSTGSERMVSGIFTTLLRRPLEGTFEAVAAPRVHCTPDGKVLAESDRLPAECRAELSDRYAVQDLGPYAFEFGGLQLARREGEWMTAVGEPRRDGAASGPAAESNSTPRPAGLD